jgi:hypothetical protein
VFIIKNLFQKIRELTLKNTDLITDNKIEECLNILVARQALLDELNTSYQLYPDNSLDYSAKYIELIHWIREQDGVNYVRIVKLKDQNIVASVKQAKVNKAIQLYKNII